MKRSPILLPCRGQSRLEHQTHGDQIVHVRGALGAGGCESVGQADVSELRRD
jgi:hypothetical protein